MSHVGQDLSAAESSFADQKHALADANSAGADVLGGVGSRSLATAAQLSSGQALIRDRKSVV